MKKITLISTTAAIVLMAISCNLNTKNVQMNESQTGLCPADSGLCKDNICIENNTRKIMDVQETDSLIIYSPNFSNIDLVCERMPSSEDTTVIFCCAAAFTGQLLNHFEHRNIAGHHVSGGIFYGGYSCNANTGCFAYYADSNSWDFAVGQYINNIKAAEDHGGMAFGQTMMIFDGKDIHNGLPCKDSSKNQYRALCELGNKLCIIDAKYSVAYKDFINKLLSIGVKNALYLDMGTGWNYSYYWDNDGVAHFIHNQPTQYTTNWITFYK